MAGANGLSSKGGSAKYVGAKPFDKASHLERRASVIARLKSRARDAENAASAWRASAPTTYRSTRTNGRLGESAIRGRGPSQADRDTARAHEATAGRLRDRVARNEAAYRRVAGG